MNKIRDTQSLCPECLKILPAEIFERDNKVLISKECPEHGKFEDVYWGDYEMYQKAMKFAHDGKGIENPNVELKNPCPQNCGLCEMHKSHTALGNIVVTNRCDLQCFYCFFYAKAMGYVYEPSLEQIRMMLRKMREEKPVSASAVQLTGGEPTIRRDIIDIIKIAKEEGYKHVQLNTNGINISRSAEFTMKVREAGVNTLYLSYDGTTAKTNPKNHWEMHKILENLRKAKMGAVLVPTVINTVNDHDVGNIVRFGIKNIDIVRGINFQPVSLVGRITKADRKKFRITIPDVIKKIEEQTNGDIRKEDWYPVPSVTPITHFLEALTNRPRFELTAHPACGMATYMFLDGDKIVPITRFLDVDGFLKFLDELSLQAKGITGKVYTSLKILSKLNSFIDEKKQPKDLNLANILYNILKTGDYSSLRELQYKSLFIGMMHFQDLYNYDIERVKRCCIHYAQPDGKIVPFCAFNVIPQWYRDKIQKEFSLPIEEWEKRTGRKLEKDFYKRDN
ncbi:MAG: tetraether lipid synthase Tes [Candidatus Aenigmatarchaeota archaeon]